MLGKIECWRKRQTTEDEMVGWHHQLNGHESEQSPGDSEGLRSKVDLSPLLDPFDSSQFILYPRAILFFQKLCPAPFPPVSLLMNIQG